MSSHVLYEEEVQVNLLRREYAKYFIQVLLGTKVREPNNTEVLEHLTLWA